MADTLTYTFHGDPGRRLANAHPDSPKNPEPYIASDGLKRAVNLAIYLRRPLLLEGEAGCGKTRLARAVAYELGLPFYEWYVRSTSKAEEGLYTYDAILRLHDVQTHKLEDRSDEATLTITTENETRGELPTRRDPRNPKAYRRFGALGKAFELKDSPAVVLIDEIDKADVDFPNDLLAVLDDPWKFEIPETGEVTAATHKPIVIITSNKEKGNLPAPFLRRCIYYFLEFPKDETRLQEIINIHYQTHHETPPSPKLARTAIQRFLSLRVEEGLHKKPGTSEFLDWLHALQNFGPDAPFSFDKLAAPKDQLPFPELLFKLRVDWHRYATSL